MNQEEKELLFKDLCARLPYGVILNVVYYDVQDDNDLTERDITLTTGNIDYCRPYRKSHWVSYKPYLRPMSNMTKEERAEHFLLTHRDNDREDNFILHDEALELIDWLIAHHFDYHGLIRKGLAIAVTEENNPYKY